jgi:tRNA-2-methylthio-N6-dimethylallyladenosine synthase
MPKYLIHTYGCQMNYSDTERMETYLEALGYEKTAKEEDTDLIIFNTCSVRQKAEDRVLGQMKKLAKLKKKNSKLLTMITGCMVRISSSRYSEKRDRLFGRLKELDLALRIEELPKLAQLIKEIQPKSKIKAIEEENIQDYFEINANHSSKFQAFVPISTGCDKFCTYCIVPYSRGREKSRPIKIILKECEELVKKGYKEITLIGQTVDSYGISNHDKAHKTFEDVPKGKLPFVYLIEQLDKLHKDGLARLRFTSPHPRDISDDLIDAIATQKTLMPYLHLPVQSGHNLTLKRMNRPYTREQYLIIIKKLREKIPDIAISTDIIVGFCDETEEEFQASLDLFQEVEFDHAYFAQYSERPGTFAAKNLKDNVPPKTKNERWHQLNNLLKKAAAKKLKKFIGKTVNVLVEKHEKGQCLGRSEHFKEVQFSSKKDLTGQIITVKILKAKNWVLLGEQK